jgi:hypothetical protein
VLVAALPVASEAATHSPQPAAELSDGSLPTVSLIVGSGPALVAWITGTARDALPGPSASSARLGASARVWVLPAIPGLSVPQNVTDFDPSITQSVATQMVHDVVLDLVIESEARRAHDLNLANDGAVPDALGEFTDVIKGDGSKIISKTYTFTTVSLTLFLPKFSTQAARLVGVTLVGTTTLATLDSSGRVLSQVTQSYDKSWGLAGGSISPDGTNDRIAQDYTGLIKA